MKRFASCNGPKGGIGQKAADELGMQGVTGLMCLDVTEQWETCKGQVADEVERFVAAAFIGGGERTVHYSVRGQHDGVVQRTAPNESHRAQRLNVTLKTEGTGARQQMAERFRAYEHLYFLLADQGMREIDVAAHAEFVGGVDTDAPVTFVDFQRLQNFDVAAFAPEPPRNGFLKHLHARLRGSGEAGHFE